MSKIRIVVDSGADLDPAQIAEHNITIVPLKIRFGTEEFTDRVDLSCEEFYRKMGASEELPSTAAPSQGAFEEAFRRLQDEGATDIICLNMSYQLSATGQAAVAAAAAVREESGGNGASIHTYDTKSVSGGVGTIAVQSALAAERGVPLADIHAMIEDLIDRTRLIGLLDTLENLQKGGRIGKARAMLGTALSIKPILEVREVVHDIGKARTRKRASLWMRDYLLRQAEEAGELSLMAVGHGFADDYDDFCALLGESFDLSRNRSNLVGPTIATHSGPNILGVTYVLGSFSLP